jgi:hypothetical protein
VTNEEIPAPPPSSTIHTVGGWNLTPGQAIGGTLHLMLPKPVSELIIAPELRVHSKDPMPNAWWRFWLYLLLGWKWRNLNESDPRVQKR